MSARRGGWFLLGAALLLVAAASGPGLVYRTATLPSGAEAHVLVVDLAAAQLRVLDARDHGATALTARRFAELSGAIAVVNASFFDIDGSPMGLLVVDGDERGALRPVDWGVFSIDETGAHIEHTEQFVQRPGLAQAVQSGPRLVVAGVPVELKRQAARRTAVCVLEDGRLEIVAVAVSVQASDLAAFLQTSGCRDALNLDGGPSTQLFLQRGEVRVDLPGGTPVPVALGVFEVAEADIGPRSGCACR